MPLTKNPCEDKRFLCSHLVPWCLVWISFLLLSTASLSVAQDTTSVIIDGAGAGRLFDGVGGLSGGGGTSRLLWDYPTQQRNEILDYLFKPGYGASLQILKVEIGSDANSTNGAEASSQRTPTDTNYNSGYEWWLMEQAKKLNPNIKLYGLEWGAPGWFNGGFWSQDNIDYIINWIKHAQSDHGLHINYIGGWNETGWNTTWYEDLKKALLVNGLTTKVVAADNGWNVAGALASDSAFDEAVDIIGVHYPCGWMQPEENCYDSTYTSVAEKLGKPIWASESGSQNYNAGAIPLARALNRDYVDSRITAYINWSLICAWYRTLPYFGDGLMLADEPWSGYYEVGKSIWVMAQTTQFTRIGWQYIDTACGYLDGSRYNGSYVTLKSPNDSDYSVIIETVDATGPHTASFTVTGGLPADKPVYVWTTDLNSSNSADYFVDDSTITPDSGKYNMTFLPGYVYTLSTTTGQGKGTATSPPSAMLRLPYTENFDEDTVGQIPKYFDSIQGAFEVDTARDGKTGMCLRQQITIPPIEWPGGSPTAPLVVVGDPSWTNYEVSVDALLEQPGYIELVGRLNAQAENSPGASQGYHLRISGAGTWSLFKEDIQGNDTQLALGTSSFSLNTWHNLALKMSGDTIEAFIDSSQVADVTDDTYASGQVGLMVSKWQNADFDNFSVTPVPGNGWISIDDEDEGSGIDQFNYVGNGWTHCASCAPGAYDSSNSWDNTIGDYVTISFEGTQIKFYGVKDTKHGIGAVSIDGGTATDIDFYSPVREGDQLMWTSPVLTPGEHTFKLAVTGEKNPNSTDTWVVPDRVEIYEPGAAAVQERPSNPTGFVLYQNSPNPFNPSTVISYNLPSSAHVTLRIFDILGQEVGTLVDGHESAGVHTVTFNASRLPSGAYFYRLVAAGANGRRYSAAKKMVVVK